MANLTDAQLIELGKQSLIEKEDRKAQIALASAKRNHRATEAMRIVTENDLESEMQPFSKTIEDFR